MALREKCDIGKINDCFSLAIAYENGFGVEQDTAMAATLYRKACQGGLKVACGKAR